MENQYFAGSIWLAATPVLISCNFAMIFKIMLFMMDQLMELAEMKYLIQLVTSYKKPEIALR